MRLPLSIPAFITALALLDGVRAADPTWADITFAVDPISPVFFWNGPWNSSFAGVTQPQPGQVGWGASQRVLDVATLPAGYKGDADASSFGTTGVSTSIRVYGDRTPEAPKGAAIFGALVNATAKSTWTKAPGNNGSAISLDLPYNITTAAIMPTGADGVYTIDGLSVTTRILTNYTSVELIPRVTELFVQNGTLNPRHKWTNNPRAGEEASKWVVRKGVSDMETVTATQPTASAAATAASSAGVTGGGPSKDSGTEDYYQAVGSSQDTTVEITIPDGTSYIVVNGTTGPQRTTLSVVLMPSPPNFRPFSTQSGGELSNNASNPWAADTVLFMRELDPTVRYTMNLMSSLFTSGPTVGIHSITYYYGLAPGGTVEAAKGKSNTAAIAGGVVGGVVGGLLLALVALYFCVWKPRKRREKEEAERDARLEDAGFTPFVQQERDAGTLTTVPPSYDPAWAGELAGSADAAGGPSPGSGSDVPLLSAGSEKQRQAAALGGAAVVSPSSPSSSTPKTPDWKVPYLLPYLPQHAGGTDLRGTPDAGARGVKGVFGKNKKSKDSSKWLDEEAVSPTSGTTEKSAQSGYSEGMMRPMNPDSQ